MIQGKIELIPNPKGIDLAIQLLQAKLSKLEWLEVCFGRCIKQIQNQNNGKDKKSRVIYPEVYYKLEPYNVMMNDNLKSYCFFHPLDPLSTPNFNHFDLELTASQEVDIIFWVNLKKVNPSKKYNFIDELRIEVYKILKTASSYIPTESYTEFENVFDPFTIHNNFEQYLKYPYAGFKIAGMLHYDFLKCVNN